MSKKRPYDKITTSMLRAEGWTVKFTHNRRFARPATVIFKRKCEVIDGAIEYATSEEQEQDFFEISARGGTTLCHLTPPGQGEVSCEGLAKCRDTDNYDYKHGTFVALRKALHAFCKSYGEFGEAALQGIRQRQALPLADMRKMVVLSTAHLTQATLNGIDPDASFYLDKTENGALSFVCSAKPELRRIPEDLWNCHAWANKHVRRSNPDEAIYILFDADGIVYKDLEAYWHD